VAASSALLAVGRASAATSFSVTVFDRSTYEGSFGGTVACFLPPQGSGLVWTATINWGEGTTTAGTVSFLAPPSDPSCPLLVAADSIHTYETAGTYTMTVQVINETGEFIGTSACVWVY
jgi:hypothetical protein